MSSQYLLNSLKSFEITPQKCLPYCDDVWSVCYNQIGSRSHVSKIWPRQATIM